MTPITIVGAGVVGWSVAWHLAGRGWREVVVVDRHGGLGGGSTARATGGFRRQFPTAVNVQLSDLSREKLLRFREETGVDPGYEPRGYLFLATEESHLEALSEGRVTRDEALAINPHIEDPDIIGGFFGPTDGFIRPMEILRGYAEAAQRMGVRCELGKTITRLDPGMMYVNAAGAWAAELCDVPVTPLRRRIACTVPTNVLPAEMPMTIWMGDGFHTRVRDGRVMLLRGDDPPNDETWLDDTVACAHRRLPSLRDIPIDPDHCWSGLYEMSPDRHAILGRHPDLPNVFLANGSSGHGVMHAPAIGQIVAEMISGEPTSIDVHALRPSRFAEGEPIVSSSLL